MSGLVLGKQRGRPRTVSKSYGEGWFFVVSPFPEHKRRWGGFLNQHCFQKYRAQGKFTIVYLLGKTCTSLPSLLPQSSAALTTCPPGPGLGSFTCTPGALTPGPLHLLLPLPAVLHPSDTQRPPFGYFTQMPPVLWDLPFHIAQFQSLLCFSP